MKAFIKALAMALFPTILTVGITLVIHFMLYGSEHFEAFFGFAIGNFNPLKYGVTTILVLTIYTLIFRSEYEEV